MATTTGIAALVKMLADFGVRRIFGNPGTTELPLNDALIDEPRIQYHLGLSEIPVVAMADGYAMASRSLGVVSVHCGCGLGNGMGMLYNAHCEGTPLLMTAGMQDRRIAFEEPILSGDLVSVARPWTKWAAKVERARDLPAAVRRAAQIALTPPTGPVFLALPMDVQMESAELDLAPPRLPDYRVRPSQAALERAAQVLIKAKNPAILVGSRVTEGDAVTELVAMAERLGATVISEPPHAHGRLGFPSDHPLYGQCMPHWAPEILARLSEYDVLFAVAVDMLRLYVYFEPNRPIPEHARLVQLDADPYQIGKNYPVEVGLVGDPKAGLADLDAMLSAKMTPADCEAAIKRAAANAARHSQSREKLRARAEAERAARPMTPLAFMASLARVLPPNVAVIEEAVTTTNTVLQGLGALKNTSGYFAHRGWGLGWGLNCAIGVQLAWPDRPTLAVIGDGAALYGIQGLWSAARYRVPVTFVIANNSQYQILKSGARALGLSHAKAGKFIGMDLNEPEVDIVGVARSFGVEAQRVTDPDELSTLVGESLAGDRPRLFDARIAASLSGPGSFV